MGWSHGAKNLHLAKKKKGIYLPNYLHIFHKLTANVQTAIKAESRCRLHRLSGSIAIIAEAHGNHLINCHVTNKWRSRVLHP